MGVGSRKRGAVAHDAVLLIRPTKAVSRARDDMLMFQPVGRISPTESDLALVIKLENQILGEVHVQQGG